MPADHNVSFGRDQLTATWTELALRLGLLALLLITIVIWSVVLTVPLYPVYDWMVSRLGGHRRLAAVFLTVDSLLIVIGPATWLVLSLIDSLRTLSEKLDLSALALPPPPITLKSWPIIPGLVGT